MLSLFPTLLAFEPLAPLILRLTLGAIYLYWAYALLKARENPRTTTLGLVDVVIGALLVVGFLTQGAALIAAILLFINLIKKIRTKALFTDGVNYYFILFAIALSLLFTGPGAFAFDMPL